MAEDIRRWARRDAADADADTPEMAAWRKQKQRAAQRDPEGDLRFETDLEYMDMCDLNEIL